MPIFTPRKCNLLIINMMIKQEIRAAQLLIKVIKYCVNLQIVYIPKEDQSVLEKSVQETLKSKFFWKINTL